jgi:hypothetical protein
MRCAPTASWAASGVPAERAVATFATTSLSAPALASSGPVAWGSNGQRPRRSLGVLLVLVVALATALWGAGTAWASPGPGSAAGSGGILGESLAAATAGLAPAGASGAVGWGENELAELGNGTNAGSGVCGVLICNPTPGAVRGLSEVTAVAGDQFHSLALLKNGTVTAWGDNALGQLGDGTKTGPEKCKTGTGEPPCSKVPVAVSGLSEVVAIAAVATSASLC